MAFVLDTGALIAVDKSDRKVVTKLKLAREEALPLRTAATVLAQVWRDGARQANLARVLAGVEVLPLEEDDARGAGELLAATGTTDVVDAHVATIVEPGDEVLTSDPQHIGRLVAARGVMERMVGV
jgi:predicted nucleic acid-binding protein